MVTAGRLANWISLGMLASRDAVDDAVEVTGKAARRDAATACGGGTLPPHVVVYFVMAMTLFADEDYEEVAARAGRALAGWGRWDESWE